MPKQDHLFDEFTPPTYDEWRAVAEAALKGAPFEKKLVDKTVEGIDRQPLYFQEDAADLPHLNSLPGEAPYVRGASASGYLIEPWLIAQELAYGTPADFNAALRYDMERGQTAVNLLLDAATRAGLDPDQSEAGVVGKGGVSLASVKDLETALKGVDLSVTPIFIRAGTVALPLMALLAALVRKQGGQTEDLQGCLEDDPLGVIAHEGTLPLSLERAYDEMAQLTLWAAEKAPKLDTIAVHGYPYINSGASAVEELAFVLATAVDYLRALVEREVPLDVAAQRMRFAFGIGGDFFMEVAKLRAARILWQKVVAAFGGDETSQQMVLHARTATYNKTVYDPYVNMLRTTMEAMAGAIGGVQSMHVAPFDEVLRQPDEFSRRIARNQQIILQQECNLTRLVDPAGGSWYIEWLTDQVAQKAWGLFQEIEAKGGMWAAMQSDLPQQKAGETGGARYKNLSQRKQVFVGTNMYANLTEKRLDDSAVDYNAIYAERSDAIQHHRTHDDSAAHTGAMHHLNLMAEASPQAMVETAIEAAKAGATLNELTRALRINDDEYPEITPVCLHRATEPFEKLRTAATAYQEKNGHLPQIFLATMGPLRQHKARADFTVGFFEVGGFELIYPSGFDTPEAAASAAKVSGAGAVVICSTDDTYPEIVPSLVSALKADNSDMVVIVAGYPKDHIDSFKEAGVDDFIHIRANCYDMNVQLQQQLGVQ